MSTDLEQQISNYFGWVESQAGVALRPPDTQQRSQLSPTRDQVATDDRSRVDFRVSELPPREPRRRARWVIAAAAAVAAIAALSLVVSNARDHEDPATTPATVAADADTSLDADSLPLRDPSLLPTVAAPSIEGWDVEVTLVSLHPRFMDGGEMVIYRLRGSGSELELSVSSGQSALSGRRVVLELSDDTVEGSLDGIAGRHILTWNSGAGASAGTTMSLFGPVEDQLIAVAQALTFDDVPLTGATTPTFVEFPANREVIMTGTVDGVDWEVSDHPADGTLVAIDGRSPWIASALTAIGSTDVVIDLTTVSFDGHQVNAIAVPADTVSVSAARRDGERIPLPIASNAAGDRKLAVAAVPAGRDVAVVAVTHADGTETLIGLPVTPPDGWTTSRSRLDPG